MKIIFLDKNPEMIATLKEFFSDLDTSVEFDFQCKSFTGSITADAVISCSNSFGILGAGFDGSLAAKYPFLQKRIHQDILGAFPYELPVGQSRIIPLSTDIRYLIFTPTMRVPGTPLKGTTNVYLAMRAAMLAVQDPAYKDIETIICPGMGTGVGGLPLEVAANQMCEAFMDTVKWYGRMNVEEIAQHESVLLNEDFGDEETPSLEYEGPSLPEFA